MDRILVVDDEIEIANLIEVYLANEGYEVIKCNNGKDALKAIDEQNIDLAVLDVMLPDMDGFGICRKIREKNYYPVIMLTARGEASDKITGLTMGADDYITKPFDPLELVARVKTQLRRYKRYNLAKTDTKQEVCCEVEFEGIYISMDTHTFSMYDREIKLTPIEFSIMWYLCINRGKVVSSEDLFESVWGEKAVDCNNTVMTHIARLREKLSENNRKSKLIQTVWGVGYKID